MPFEIRTPPDPDRAEGHADEVVAYDGVTGVHLECLRDNSVWIGVGIAPDEHGRSNRLSIRIFRRRCPGWRFWRTYLHVLCEEDG